MTINHSVKRMEACVKYEYDMTSNIKVLKVCGYCHDNKVSLVTSYSMSWYAPRTTVSDFGFLPFQITP